MLPIRLFANALRQEMDRSYTHCVYLSARVVLERQLNKLVAATRNKASALFSTGAIHLDHLLRTYGHRPMTIVCDQQGGRGHYGSLLRLMFEEWSLEVLEEREGFADYRMFRPSGGDDHSVRIIFREKAEVGCMPVALASMLSKYLREALMRRFNAFWLRAAARSRADGGILQRRGEIPERHSGETAADGNRGRGINSLPLKPQSPPDSQVYCEATLTYRMRVSYSAVSSSFFSSSEIFPLVLASRIPSISIWCLAMSRLICGSDPRGARSPR